MHEWKIAWETSFLVIRDMIHWQFLMFMKPKLSLHVQLSYVDDYLKILGTIWHVLIA